MQVYELFDGSGPGAYWFWTGGPRCWVVADLDTGKAHQVKQMVRLDVHRWSDACEAIDTKRGCLARVGDRCLLDFDKALRYVMDYPDDFDKLSAVCYGEKGDVAEANVWTLLSSMASVLAKVRSARPNDA